MRMRSVLWWSLALALIAAGNAVAETPVDLADYDPACEVRVEGWNGHLRLSWPLDAKELGNRGEITLDLNGTAPIIQRLATRSSRDDEPSFTILRNVDPAWWFTVGSRQMPEGKPADQQWEVFFDNPHTRPHEVHASKLHDSAGERHRQRLTGDRHDRRPHDRSVCRRGRVHVLRRLAASSASMRSCRPRRTGWRSSTTRGSSPTNRRGRSSAGSTPKGISTARHRSPAPRLRSKSAIARSSPSATRGSVACFPPPHQFQFPRDYSTNLGFVWHGRGYQGQAGKTGFGIRQNKDGGGNFVPWFNAPPGRQQRLGMFFSLSPGQPSEALDETLTLHPRRPLPRAPRLQDVHQPLPHGDRRHRDGGDEAGHRSAPSRPTTSTMFKDMGVNMVHLGEFHGDGHPKDPGPLRLPEMQAMFDECRRWSDDKLLLIPGEEVNDFLGLKLTGKHPGHWMSLFPRPVYWTMARGADQPFVEESPAIRQGLSRRRPRRHDPADQGGAGPGLVGPSADQGLELDARHLPRGGFLPRRVLARRRVEGDARRPLAREARRAGARTCWTTWPTGGTRNTCSARSMSSRSTTRTSCTAT